MTTTSHSMRSRSGYLADDGTGQREFVKPLMLFELSDDGDEGNYAVGDYCDTATASVDKDRVLGDMTPRTSRRSARYLRGSSGVGGTFSGSWPAPQTGGVSLLKSFIGGVVRSLFTTNRPTLSAPSELAVQLISNRPARWTDCAAGLLLAALYCLLAMLLIEYFGVPARLAAMIFRSPWLAVGRRQ